MDKQLNVAKKRRTIDRKRLELLINKIYLSGDNTLEIVWNFQEQFDELKETFDNKKQPTNNVVMGLKPTLKYL